MDTPAIPKRPARKSAPEPASSEDSAAVPADVDQSLPLASGADGSTLASGVSASADTLNSSHEDVSDGDRTPGNSNTKITFKDDSDDDAAASESGSFNDDQVTVSQDRDEAEAIEASEPESDRPDAVPARLADLNGSGLISGDVADDSSAASILSDGSQPDKAEPPQAESFDEPPSVMPIIPKRPKSKALSPEPEAISSKDTEAEKPKIPVIPKRPKADAKPSSPQIPQRPRPKAVPETKPEAESEAEPEAEPVTSTEAAVEVEETEAKIPDTQKESVAEQPVVKEPVVKEVSADSEKDKEASDKTEAETEHKETETVKTETTSSEKAKTEDKKEDIEPAESKPASKEPVLEKTVSNTPAIPSRRPVKAAAIQSPQTTGDAEKKPKAPPPKPKKLSSKIAAFQQMLSQNQPPVSPPSKSKEEAPERPSATRSKLSSSHMQFAQNLKGIVGRGVAMPGMVDPATLAKQAESEEQEDEPVDSVDHAAQKPPETARRAKGPRGKRLPKSLKTPVNIEQESKFKIATHHLWDLSFTKKEVPVSEDKAVQSSKEADLDEAKEPSEEEIESKSGLTEKETEEPPAEDSELFEDASEEATEEAAEVPVLEDNAPTNKVSEKSLEDPEVEELEEITRIEKGYQDKLRETEQLESLSGDSSEKAPVSSSPLELDDDEDPLISDEVRKIESSAEHKVKDLEESESL